MPELNEVVTLVYEDGEEETFSVEDVMELDGNTYVVLVPEEQDAQAEEGEEVDACIFRVEKSEDGEEVLVDLDDDEYERVTDALCQDSDEGEGEDEDEADETDEASGDASAEDEDEQDEEDEWDDSDEE